MSHSISASYHNQEALYIFTTLALTIKCLNGGSLELKSPACLSLCVKHSQDI